MMAGAFPYMPLYINDYLADCSHLTTRQHGAYLLLLMSYWQRGKPLPDDDEKLARICRMRLADWKRDRDVLCELFEVSSSGWTQNRVEHELQRVRDKSLKNSKAGSTSAQRRLSKRSTNADQTFNHTDTDTDTEKEETPTETERSYYWAGIVAKLNRRDFLQWEKDYSFLDLRGALAARDAWLADQPPDVQKKWFNSTKSHFANLNQKAVNDLRSRSEARVEPGSKYEGISPGGVAYLP